MTDASPLCRAFLAHGRAEDCPVISAHAHYGPYSGIYFPDRGEADSLLKMMDRAGVARAVFARHLSLFDAERGNDLTAEVIRAHPSRFAGYLTIKGASHTGQGPA